MRRSIPKSKRLTILRASLLGAVAACLPAAPAVAATYGPGASDTEIKIGNTNPYSGPIKAFGRVGRTLNAYFDKLNFEEGGINGRMINFISLDDGYDPAKTQRAVRRLIERDKVLLLFQTLGTPTNSAIRAYINKQKVPHLFLASGASKWASPKTYPWTMGWNAAFQSEAQIYAKHVLKHVKNPRIAVFYENVEYGRDYLRGLRAGLGRRARRSIVKQVAYDASVPATRSGILALKQSGANVFMNFAQRRPMVDAIAYKAILGWRARQYVRGSADIRLLRAAGKDRRGNSRAAGIFTSGYLKDPNDRRWRDDPGILEYRKFMAEYNSGTRANVAISLYAYTVAQVMAHVLRRAGDDLTRANVMKQAANIHDLRVNTLYPGITINTSPSDFRPIETLVLSQFDGKRWRVVSAPIAARGGTRD